MSAPELTPEQRAAVDRFARFLVRTGLTVPAILTLESMRPLSFVGSQLMHVLTPSLGVFLTTTEWEALAALLERREGMDAVLAHIERLDAHWRAHGEFPEAGGEE